MTLDELIDQNRALNAELLVERQHRESAEAYADACDELLRSLLAPVGWSGAERRKQNGVADWTGLDRRQTH